ncbi:hypothetical protein MIND_01226000 [Mycena indigotica]|uniref:Uncharacterized protein n=1 Tax=Mycena indigotica TaxID=2126181 RepID=A0A8H6S3G6_9AGAR|nr:uncharacterized protein MIND_01226000 [Mycena indigotica]KAF7292003.1 hypothetical protein MIND_01226000 [Mycena indigotica]
MTAERVSREANPLFKVSNDLRAVSYDEVTHNKWLNRDVTLHDMIVTTAARPTSPPLVAGTIRPRPNDSSSGSSDSEEPLATTRSPHTRRVVKRGKTDAQPADIGPPQPDNSHHDHLTEALPTALAAGTAAAMEGLAAVWPPEHLPLLSALEALLRRAIATTGALQLEGETTPDYPPTTLALIQALVARVSRPTPTLAPTYASVTSISLTQHAPATLPAVPTPSGNRPETMSSQNNLPAATTDTPTTPAPAKATQKDKQSKKKKKKGHRSPQRLIIRWIGYTPLPEERPTETQLVAALEGATGPGNHESSRIQGVAWTPAGNLAVYTRAPYTAAQLVQQSRVSRNVEYAIRTAFNDWSLDMILDADAPWTWMVLHGVPAAAFWDDLDAGGSKLTAQLVSQGYSDGEVLTHLPMVRADIEREAVPYVSIKLACADQEIASRLASKGGLFLFDAFCRAAKYRS